MSSVTVTVKLMNVWDNAVLFAGDVISITGGVVSGATTSSGLKVFPAVPLLIIWLIF